MNRGQAHALLDAARAGRRTSRGAIELALQVTGDLQPLRLFDRHGKRVSDQLPSRSTPADPTRAPAHFAEAA